MRRMRMNSRLRHLKEISPKPETTSHPIPPILFILLHRTEWREPVTEIRRGSPSETRHPWFPACMNMGKRLNLLSKMSLARFRLSASQAKQITMLIIRRGIR